jgi:hypothetical protein
VPVALLAVLVLAIGTSCSWGDDGASGGDTAPTGNFEDEDEDGGGGGSGGGGGGAKPSPILLSRATDLAGGGFPVDVIAAEAAADMAAECPGDKLCVEIDVQSDYPNCHYVESDPIYAEGMRIDVGSTVTLFGDCSERLVPDPDNPGQYIPEEPGTEGTDEPSAPSSPPPTEPTPTAPSPEPS